jgi:GTP cyclohydrolase N terminal
MTTELRSPSKHIRLTSHPGQQGTSGAPAIHWGAATAAERGPVVGTTANRSQRNVIGTHSGSYGVYRALAVAAGNLVKGHRADLTNTAPTHAFGPWPAWGDASKIVSLDPWGASVADVFADHLARGYDIRPTIAVTQAHVHLPEIRQAIAFQRLQVDGKVLLDDGSAVVTKAAIEPVWWLPGVAKRFNVSEADLRRSLFEETGGMYPELVTRSDIEVFLPPIGGQTSSARPPIWRTRR